MHATLELLTQCHHSVSSFTSFSGHQPSLLPQDQLAGFHMGKNMQCCLSMTTSPYFTWYSPVPSWMQVTEFTLSENEKSLSTYSWVSLFIHILVGTSADSMFFTKYNVYEGAGLFFWLQGSLQINDAGHRPEPLAQSSLRVHTSISILLSYGSGPRMLMPIRVV